MSKIIWPGRFVGALLDILASQLMKVYALLARFFQTPSAIMVTASAIIDGANQIKICGEVLKKQEKNSLK